MKDGLWKFDTTGGYCFKVRGAHGKRVQNLVVHAISKPEPLSKQLCVTHVLFSEIDVTQRPSKFKDQEHLIAMAAAPCSEVKLNTTIGVPEGIDSSELSGLSGVLETFISKVNDGDQVVRFEDEITKTETTGISLKDIVEIRDFKRKSETESVEKLEIDFQLRTNRNDNTIGKASVKMDSWKIIQVIVSNAHWSDLE
jgi:hypothetical protein